MSATSAALVNLTGRPIEVGGKTIAPSDFLPSLKWKVVREVDGVRIESPRFVREPDFDTLLNRHPWTLFIVDDDVATALRDSAVLNLSRVLVFRSGRLVPLEPLRLDLTFLETWVCEGLVCAVGRNPLSTLNGYVQLPDEHPLRFRSDLKDIVSVHGGITWGPDDDGWVGWDTLHHCDEIPGVQTGHHWSLEDVKAETDRLARQLSTGEREEG